MAAEVNRYNFVLHYVFLKVPDDLTDTRGVWKSKVDVLERTLWRIRFGEGYGPIIREIAP
jgi:hypothetical protein